MHTSGWVDQSFVAELGVHEVPAPPPPPQDVTGLVPHLRGRNLPRNGSHLRAELCEVGRDSVALQHPHQYREAALLHDRDGLDGLLTHHLDELRCSGHGLLPVLL